MKTRIWITSDTHFYHDNIIKFCRPSFNNLEEMHKHIILEWNKLVKKEDIVIHLGDVSFKLTEKKEEITKIINKLNGRKILLPGNHDREMLNKNRHYFNEIGFENVIYEKTLVINNIILSHEPLEIIPAGYFNYHGHTHNSIASKIYALDKRRINVCLDANDYKLIDIAKILEGEQNE